MGTTVSALNKGLCSFLRVGKTLDTQHTIYQTVSLSSVVDVPGV